MPALIPTEVHTPTVCPFGRRDELSRKQGIILLMVNSRSSCWSYGRWSCLRYVNFGSVTRAVEADLDTQDTLLSFALLRQPTS